MTANSRNFNKDKITLGIIGIGDIGSLGFTILQQLNTLKGVDKVLISNRDNDNSRKKLRANVRAKLGANENKNKISIEGIKTIANESDVVILSYDNAMGTAKNMGKNLPLNLRDLSFNANIADAIKYGAYFGVMQSEATILVYSNPTDKLAHFFRKAYVDGRTKVNSKFREDIGQILGGNHLDAYRVTPEIIRSVLRNHTDKNHIISKISGIDAILLGPHNPNLVISRYRTKIKFNNGKIRYSSNLQELNSESTHDQSDYKSIHQVFSEEEIKLIEKAIHKNASLTLREAGSTSGNTTESLVPVFKAISDERTICHMSYPEKLNTRDYVHVGRPVTFSNGRAIPFDIFNDENTETNEDRFARAQDRHNLSSIVKETYLENKTIEDNHTNLVHYRGGLE